MLHFWEGQNYADSVTAEKSHKTVWPILSSVFNVDEIYNAVETSIFNIITSDMTFKFNGELYLRKLSQNHLVALVFANM